MSDKNSYYAANDIVVIDVIKAKLTPEQYEGFLLGSVIKYSLRLNFKNQRVSDAAKLAEYAMWLNEEYYGNEYKESSEGGNSKNEESSLERISLRAAKEEVEQRYFEGRHRP